MSYEGVMSLAREYSGQTDWLKVVKGCYEEAKELDGKRFPGKRVVQRVGWFPGLNKLAKYGIVKKEGETTRGGKRAYWSISDMEGVERALKELDYL